MSSLHVEKSLLVSSEKISTPIEDLNLEQRAFHMLKRADINTVSQIIAVGKSKILSIRNIGSLSADRIFLAIADFLGLSEDALARDEIIELALREVKKQSKHDMPINPLNTSIDILDLPIKTNSSLKKEGIYRIEQLIKLKFGDYQDIGSKFEHAKIKRIDRALRLYLNSLEKVETVQVVARLVVPAKQLVEAKQTQEFSRLSDLKSILNLLYLRERDWLIVELRSIRLMTLEEIAVEIGGVTRERVRQILDKINRKIQERLDILLIFLDFFNEKAKIISKRLQNKNLTIEKLAEKFRYLLFESNLVGTKEDVERFIAIIRLIVISDKFWERQKIEVTYKDITFLACFANPVIEKHEKVQRVLEVEKEKNRKCSYKEIAYTVLTEAKKPLHWREIAEKAYRLNKKERFETRALYHALLSHEDIFVRVGQGTYELVEWGSKQVAPYPDIIASILDHENRPVPLEVIFARVLPVRSIKKQSLSMYLDMHPRFYKSINNQ